MLENLSDTLAPNFSCLFSHKRDLGTIAVKANQYIDKRQEKTHLGMNKRLICLDK
jgi:hypothetical protein